MKKIVVVSLISFFYLITLCAGDMDIEKKLYPMYFWEEQMKKNDQDRQKGLFLNASINYRNIATNLKDRSIPPSIRRQAGEILQDMERKKERWNGVPREPEDLLAFGDEKRTQGEYEIAARCYKKSYRMAKHILCVVYCSSAFRRNASSWTN